ncbi:MAG: 2-oxo acid dehydrogenase subunit E2 [Actinobacteria bacterium]|nr:2-oxo acid dehydrogenase subunit E2 [Actinomycetota bacterium]
MSSSPTEPVTMPQMGVSVAEGTLVAWHKQVGDRVDSEETICEISTDKIDTDVPSPAAGRVTELLVAEGETVAVGTVLALVEVDAFPAGDGGGDAGEPLPARMPAACAPPGGAPAGAQPEGRYSPVVRRIAAEHGIDLALVVGTGRGGRVRKEDVLAVAEAGAPRKGAQAAGMVEAAAGQAPPPGEERAVREPLSRMRRAIGEHMTRSLRTAAHCTTIIEVDMGRVEAARAPAGLSPLPYVAHCAVESLGGVFGRLNATLEDDVLTRYADVDLGVAVSLGEAGLIVPVIRAAQYRSVAGLAAEIRELARRARASELAPDDVRGATFTITNPGRFGTIAATPIINQPQVAILDLEAVVRRPVVVGEGIAIRPMANLCLSWDHRALDGVMAAEFLADVRARIERFEG